MRIFQLISTYFFTWVDQIGLEVRSGSCTGSVVRKDPLNDDLTRRSIDHQGGKYSKILKMFHNFLNVFPKLPILNICYRFITQIKLRITNQFIKMKEYTCNQVYAQYYIRHGIAINLHSQATYICTVLYCNILHIFFQYFSASLL